MCKCSILVCLAWAACAALAQQEYDVGEPNDGEVVFNGVRGADVALLFDSDEVIVNPGDTLNLDCGVQGDFRSCVWEAASGTYQIEDVYSNLYSWMGKPAVEENNQCGITINSANIEHHGIWTCKVYVRGNSLVGKKKVVVTIKPTTPVLEIDQPGGTLEVSNAEETEVKCSVAGARPAADIRWYLGDKDVTVFAAADQTPNGEEDMHKTVSTLSRTFEPSENGRLLTCTVMHQTLLVPDNTSIPISVIFKPIEKPLSTYYQIVPGSDYEVKLNFSANPPPTRTEWRYGEGFQNLATSIPVPGATDRYTTSVEELGDGQYTAKLHISGFTDADANQRYVLFVENGLGATQYQVKLSMDEAPLDGDSEYRDHDKIPPTEFSVSEGIVFDGEMESNALSGGAVAGIVIVILIVVVAVVAAGYARYRQMFCFAPAAAADPEEGKDIKEEHSDTESARGPNTTRAANIKNSIGKLTQVFKKPKKDQETKLEEADGSEDKKYVKEETKKDSPKEEQGNDKELPGQTQIPPDTLQIYANSEFKSPEVQKQQTEEKKEITVSRPNNDQKPPEQKNEVVYAELDLSKGEGDKKSEVKSEDKTEYAQIIGTVTDNREEEKKE